jgi:hypothetical protein
LRGRRPPGRDWTSIPYSFVSRFIGNGTFKVPYSEAVEKRSPAYDLDSIKATFSTVATLRITRTATRDYRALGFTATDVVTCIQGLQRAQLYKSMTSDQDHRIGRTFTMRLTTAFNCT